MKIFILSFFLFTSFLVSALADDGFDLGFTKDELQAAMNNQNLAFIEQAKIKVMSRILSRRKVQEQIAKDNYQLANIRFVEADNGGTEPVYYVETLSEDSSASRCYYLEFYLDTPATWWNSLRETDPEECQ